MQLSPPFNPFFSKNSLKILTFGIALCISDIAFSIDASFLVTAPQIREIENNGARVFKAIEIVNAKQNTPTVRPGGNNTKTTTNSRKKEEDEDWTAWKDPNPQADSTANNVRPKRVLTQEDSLLMQRRKLHQDSIRAGLIR